MSAELTLPNPSACTRISGGFVAKEARSSAARIVLVTAIEKTQAARRSRETEEPGARTQKTKANGRKHWPRIDWIRVETFIARKQINNPKIRNPTSEFCNSGEPLGFSIFSGRMISAKRSTGHLQKRRWIGSSSAGVHHHSRRRWRGDRSKEQRCRRRSANCRDQSMGC
jgi:hypothetical protein